VILVASYNLVSFLENLPTTVEQSKPRGTNPHNKNVDAALTNVSIEKRGIKKARSKGGVEEACPITTKLSLLVQAQRKL
jgi:hypothetical protein